MTLLNIKCKNEARPKEVDETYDIKCFQVFFFVIVSATPRNYCLTMINLTVKHIETIFITDSIEFSRPT